MLILDLVLEVNSAEKQNRRPEEEDMEVTKKCVKVILGY